MRIVFTILIIFFVSFLLCAFDKNDISFYLPLDGNVEPEVAGGSKAVAENGENSKFLFKEERISFEIIKGKPKILRQLRFYDKFFF